jgi:hypothetical protein
MPYHVRAEELLARWREAERRHASTAPGTPEFEETRFEIDALHQSYQQVVDAAEEFDLSEHRPVHSAQLTD